MNSAAYLTLRDDARTALREHRLLDALSAIEGQLSYAGCQALRQDIAALRQDYTMLLNYLHQGASDATRHAQHLHFLRRAYEMAERIHRDYLFSQSGLHRAELWSKLQQGEIAPQLAVVLQSGTSFRLLFEVVWTGPAWGKDEVGLASAYLAAPHAPYLKASLLAAVTLSLFSSYDARRMDFLLDTLAAVDDAFLYDRALVGVVLALVRHAEVMPFFPEQVRRIHAFVARQERFVRRLRRLQKFLLAILETPTVTKNLEEEVLSLIIDTTTKAPSSALGDDEVRFPDEESPEAAETQQRLLEHMHRYLHFHRMGMDMGYRSFQHIMRRLPFFNTAAHWFAPLAPEHPEVLCIAPPQDFLDHLLAANDCTTRSFALLELFHASHEANTEAGQTQAEQILSQMQKPTVSVDIVDEQGNPIVQKESSMRNFVIDLYRFCQLFPYRNESENPFRANLFLLDNPYLAPALRGEDYLQELAEFCRDLEDTPHAYELYSRLPQTPECLRHLGDCCYKMKRWEEAARHYDHYLLSKGEDEEVLQRLANCHFYLKHYEDALVHLIHLEAITPEDYDVLQQTAICFMYLELFNDALPRLQRMLYDSPDDLQAHRLCAWCLMMLHRFDDAARHYDHLLAHEPTANDFYNAGHNAWLSADVPTAVVLYSECLKARNLHFAPHDFFEEDRSDLITLGLSAQDFRLMIDLLNHNR